MTLMRRAFAILKYVPGVLCGLLVVAWVVSLGNRFGINSGYRNFFVSLCFESVTAELWYGNDETMNGLTFMFTNYGPVRPLGDLAFYPSRPSLNDYITVTAVPIPMLLTALLPFTLFPFTRFRFPLWSYFVWTALLAAELAFYLR